MPSVGRGRPGRPGTSGTACPRVVDRDDLLDSDRSGWNGIRTLKLFDELKRRNVFKVGAAYLALAWAVVEVTGTVAPMFDLPPWIGRVVVWIGIVGFPFALLFAWIYELTPEGLRRTDEVAPAESVTHATGRKLQLAIAVLLAIAIAVFVLDRFVIDRARAPAAVVATAPAGASPVTPTPAATARPSIAVLPFADMSQARDQEYFADGLSEELLNLLAQLPQLRVIARTSSFSFKGKEADVATIAKTLGVDHVLEGSVRTSGDRLRVTAQLVRASDSTPLWSRTFDRRLTDVFAMQDEIAAAVVEALSVQLLPSQSVTGRYRTSNPEAYDLYLLGLQNLRNTRPDDSRRAVEALRRAVALDPAFAPAWAQLGLAEFYVAEFDAPESELAAGRQRALAAVDHAIDLAPGLAESYAVRGALRQVVNWDWAGAEQDLNRALELEASNAYAQLYYERLLSSFGRFPEAIAVMNRHLASDPLDADGWAEMAHLNIRIGDRAAARSAAQRAAQLNPDSDLTLASLSAVELADGRPRAALEVSARLSPFWQTYIQAMALWNLGDRSAARRAMDTLQRDYSKSAAFQIASVYAWWGDKDKAMEWLERAYENRDGGLSLLQRAQFFEHMRDDPRFISLLRKMGLQP